MLRYTFMIPRWMAVSVWLLLSPSQLDSSLHDFNQRQIYNWSRLLAHLIELITNTEKKNLSVLVIILSNHRVARWKVIVWKHENSREQWLLTSLRASILPPNHASGTHQIVSCGKSTRSGSAASVRASFVTQGGKSLCQWHPGKLF